MSERAPAGPSRAQAIVIGAGFGGLAAAVRLGARGYRVTVLERLDAPGGRASVFRQDGFTFDAGPTIVTAPALFEELWTLCGRRMADDVELRALDPFYRVRFDDGSSIDWSGDPAAMRAMVERLRTTGRLGLRAHHGAESTHLSSGLRAARPCSARQLSRHAAAAACDGAAARRSLRCMPWSRLRYAIRSSGFC